MAPGQDPANDAELHDVCSRPSTCSASSPASSRPCCPSPRGARPACARPLDRFEALADPAARPRDRRLQCPLLTRIDPKHIGRHDRRQQGLLQPAPAGVRRAPAVAEQGRHAGGLTPVRSAAACSRPPASSAPSPSRISPASTCARPRCWPAIIVMVRTSCASPPTPGRWVGGQIFRHPRRLRRAGRAGQTRHVVFIANLAPRKMRFGLSEGMILSAGSGGGELFLLDVDSGARRQASGQVVAPGAAYNPRMSDVLAPAVRRRTGAQPGPTSRCGSALRRSPATAARGAALGLLPRWRGLVRTTVLDRKHLLLQAPVLSTLRPATALLASAAASARCTAACAAPAALPRCGGGPCPPRPMVPCSAWPCSLSVCAGARSAQVSAVRRGLRPGLGLAGAVRWTAGAPGRDQCRRRCAVRRWSAQSGADRHWPGGLAGIGDRL